MAGIANPLFLFLNNNVVQPSVTSTVLPHQPRTTVWDVIEIGRDYLGGDPGAETDRVVHRAIQSALRELVNSHQWLYYYTHGRIQGHGFYTTGTIQFQASSGSVPNLVTLTGGTWPTWANLGSLRTGSVTTNNLANTGLGTVIYDVDQVIDSTHLTLIANLAPIVDIAAGTSFTLFQDTYDLPTDFVNTDQGFADVSWGGMEYVHPNKWLQVNRYYACTDLHTQLLSNRGWLNYDEIRPGDKALTYDHQTGELTWQPIQAVNVYDYDGDLLSLERRGEQFLFTEDHNWPVEHHRGKRSIVKAKEFKKGMRIPRKGHFLKEGDSVLSPRLARILGWAVTDGTGMFKNAPSQARVAQSPKKFAGEMAVAVGTRVRLRSDGMHICALDPEDWADIRWEIDSKEELPALVCNLDRQAAEAMWEAMFQAEGGHGTRQGPNGEDWGQQVFSQAEHNRPIIDAFQILSILTGRVCHIRGGGREGALQATVCKSDFINPTAMGGLKRVPYRGKVWCPTTPAGTWIARRNGHVIITGNSYSNTPRFYTITGSPKSPNRMCWRIFPFPDSDRTLDFVYKRRARYPTLDSYTVGNAIVDSQGAPQLVYGNGTAWTTSMVGSVIRLSNNVTPPTSWAGSNVYAIERNIVQVQSPTQLLVDDSATQSLSNVAYRISDPVDMEETAMLEAYIRCVEKHIAMMRNMKDAPARAAMYEQALVFAKEADARSFASRVAGVGGPYRQRLANMPRGPDIS